MKKLINTALIAGVVAGMSGCINDNNNKTTNNNFVTEYGKKLKKQVMYSTPM